MSDEDVVFHLNFYTSSAPNPDMRRRMVQEELNWLFQQGKISKEQYERHFRRISLLYPEETKKEEDPLKNPLFLMLLLSSFLSGFNTQRDIL